MLRLVAIIAVVHHTLICMCKGLKTRRAQIYCRHGSHPMSVTIIRLVVSRTANGIFKFY